MLFRSVKPITELTPVRYSGRRSPFFWSPTPPFPTSSGRRREVRTALLVESIRLRAPGGARAPHARSRPSARRRLSRPRRRGIHLQRVRGGGHPAPALPEHRPGPVGSPDGAVRALRFRPWLPPYARRAAEGQQSKKWALVGEETESRRNGEVDGAGGGDHRGRRSHRGLRPPQNSRCKHSRSWEVQAS